MLDLQMHHQPQHGQQLQQHQEHHSIPPQMLQHGSYDDSFVHFNGLGGDGTSNGPSASFHSSSTFAVHSNSPQQWGTLPRALKLNSSKPVAKVPAYPRPPQPPQVPASFFEEKLKKQESSKAVEEATEVEGAA